VNLREFRLFADQNIHADVVEHLRRHGFDVVSVRELGLQGTDDLSLIRRAYQQQRVIVTHDPDFGALAIVQAEPIVGILFIRPGHIRPEFTIATLDVVLNANLDLTLPFVLVAQRSAKGVTIRLRQL
jgi:predicted nuclease of predicted toxin-antitoxin system